MKRDSRAPLIIAIALLLLPVLYVGSYMALVRPGRYNVQVNGQFIAEDYRCCPKECGLAFWPLEQIDRKLRPGTWKVKLEKQGGGLGILSSP